MACIHYRAGCTRSYISGVPGPDEEGTYGYARKSEKDGFHPLFPSSEKDKGGSPAPVRTFFSRSAYIVSSVYETHFKTFTLLCLYVYDRYRGPSWPPSSRQFLDILLRRHRDQRTLPGVKDRILYIFSLFSFSLSREPLFAISKSSLSPCGPPRKFIVLRRRHLRSQPSLGA